jgi:hypothetical protein
LTSGPGGRRRSSGNESWLDIFSLLLLGLRKWVPKSSGSVINPDLAPTRLYYYYCRHEIKTTKSHNGDNAYGEFRACNARNFQFLPFNIVIDWLEQLKKKRSIPHHFLRDRAPKNSKAAKLLLLQARSRDRHNATSSHDSYVLLAVCALAAIFRFPPNPQAGSTCVAHLFIAF